MAFPCIPGHRLARVPHVAATPPHPAQGICLWLITVAGGMALRIASGNTAELPFVIVATIVLAVFLLGHRFIAAWVARRNQRP